MLPKSTSIGRDTVNLESSNAKLMPMPWQFSHGPYINGTMINGVVIFLTLVDVDLSCVDRRRERRRETAESWGGRWND